jgi:hypothetical protein
VNRFRFLYQSSSVKRLAVAGLLSGLAGAHVYVTPVTTGPLLVLDHLFDITLVLALLAICASLGSWLLARCRVALEQPVEALVFSIGVGAGILATTILICGLLSCLQAFTLGLILLSFAFLTRKELAQLPASMVQCLTRLKTHSSTLGLVFFGAVALFMLLMALEPPLDWDSLMYHLRVPAQFLTQGRIYLPEDNLHTAYVGLAHMLYIPLIAFGSQSGSALLSAFFALALGLAVFELCLQFLSDGTAGLSLCSLWGSTIILITAITPRVDVALAFFLFLAHYALLKALSDSSTQSVFYLSACLLGLAVGIKYPAIIYIVALAPLIVRVAWRRPERFLGAARNLAIFSVLCTATAFPWLAKNWLLLGSPLYPFLGDTRIEPWLAAFYPDRAVAFPIIHETLRWVSQVSAPFSILTLILAPGALAVETEGALYYPNPIFLLLPLWVFLIWRNRILNWLMLPAVGYLIILILYWPYGVVRYLMPALAPFTIVSVDIAVRAWQRFVPSRLAVGLSALIFGITLMPFGVIVKAYLVKTDVLAHAIGRSSAENHLSKRRRVYAEIVSYVNQNLPKEARVLLIYEARGYYFNVPVIQDNALTNWPLLARSEAATNCLRSTGISHVLVNVESLRYYLRRGVDPQSLQWDAFREFSRRCLTPIRGTRAYTLFRVKE